MSKLAETNLMIDYLTKLNESGIKIDNAVILADIAKSLAMIADKLCEAESEGIDKMRVEEMALRSEIRQMLNEAGFNKNTLKEEVKSVLREEIEKAVKQAVNETDFDGYVKRTADSIIKAATRKHLADVINDRFVSKWFNRK